uniref:Reverse transcriptase domain-containing protein n=1 Tax=Tanacetum cinerariifolium TaxID=118510 RepID=A0A699GY68_TANCI|nr:reverse transcriptase domain-containing protein [Tanacetum cinerariifolium]
MDKDLRKPFKEARRTSRTRRIIKFAGLEYKMPANIKLYDSTTDPDDHLSRFASAANSGEWPMRVWCRMFQQTLDGSARGWYSVRRACFKEPHEITKIVRKANESLTVFKERWTVETVFIMGIPVVMKISSFMDVVKSPELAKRFSNKVSATVNEMMERLDEFVRFEEAYARTELPRGEVGETHHRASHETPIGTATIPRKKGHYTNDCLLLRKQLEMALDSGKLNHLVKDVRQRGRGLQGREAPNPAKVINVISVNSMKDNKRKGREVMELWMNVPISFPTISSDDVFEEPLIVKAKVEGYLARRVYVDAGSSVEVMFEHCFENLDSRIKAKLKETQTDLNIKTIRKDKAGGRPGLKPLRAILSTIHSMMKFPTPRGVATLVTQTIIIAECRRLERKQMVKESSEGERGVTSTEEVLINPSFPDQRVTIDGGLSEACRDQLKHLLKDNMEKETLYAYMSVSAEAVSAVLLTDRKGRQCPVQYVSKTVSEAERNYAPMEKLALSLIHMTRQLRRYFEAYLVKVITDQPIKNILNNTETSGKLAKYAVELGAYNITYIPQTAVKGQTLFTDGALSPKGSEAGLVLIGPNGIEYTYVLRLTFPSTNNEAEYEALMEGLGIARQMNISNIEVKVDSKLVASQINRNYKASKDSMIKYLAKAKEYTSGFKSFSIKNIPRNMNQKADVLSKLAFVAFNRLTKEVNYVIREIHMGSCGMHVGPRAVVRKAVRQGYYWPSMHKDAKKGVEKCDSTTVSGKWGAKFIILAIDYFTKWIEAKPLVKITRNEVIRFVMYNIIYRSLMEGIKTHLGREKARWVDELSNVLWAHRTSIKQSNGETPFSLTYGSEAVIPAEIGMPTYQTLMIREGYNEEEMRLNLDLLQERREAAAIRETRYKTKMEQYYNKKVPPLCLGLKSLCSEETKQVGLRTRASWDQNGKDHTGSWKRTKMVPTS